MWHFRTWFSRHSGVGVMAGLDDLRGLSNLKDSKFSNKTSRPCYLLPSSAP